MVTLPVVRVRCGFLSSNQFKECECVVEFPLIHLNVFISGYDQVTLCKINKLTFFTE